MYFATKSRQTQILVWVIWLIACLVFLTLPETAMVGERPMIELPAWAGIVTHDPRNGSPFPWQPRRRLRKWAWQRYCTLRRAHRRAVWTARFAQLALTGALSLAQLVDLVTRSQLRRHLGALPVLYSLLEALQIRDIINRHCPTRAQVDHGTVALVLILNRLTMPLPLYQIADWLAQTVLIYTLGMAATQFNDDRLARTLDAIQPHCRDIWEVVVQRALVQAEIDLSIIFYDLTAFVVHGAYSGSQHVDFGFANNTPMNKRKFKIGLDVTADGHIPSDYKLWPGRATDMATVQENMERLRRLLKRRGLPRDEVLVVGDRANVDDKLALAYDDRNLRYLAGLRLLKKVHQKLVEDILEKQFYAGQPLTDERGPRAYWGVPCQAPFQPKNSKRKVTHRGLVVLSGPMRTALRQSRAARLKELRQALMEVQSKLGQPYYRTVKSVQRKANAKLNASPVGKFMRVKAYIDEQGQVCLHWWVASYPLWQAMQRDGRYLLVTNDWSLSPQQMLALYHQKDGVEKRICVSKSQLKVSPIYLHKDERIEAMLLLNMFALLAYSVLERQARRNGLQMTTRRIIEKLQNLDVVETNCWDGSRLLRLAPMDEEQAILLDGLVRVLADFRLPRWPYPLLPGGNDLLLALPPPGRDSSIL
jgi:transposase